MIATTVFSLTLVSVVTWAYDSPVIDDVDADFVVEKLLRDDLMPNVTVIVPAETTEARHHKLSSDDTLLDPLEARQRKSRAAVFRTGPNCSDTSNVRINGMTCKQVFDRLGAAVCNSHVLEVHCCGTRRMYCQTCLVDSVVTFNGGETCDNLLSRSTVLCDHHLVIHHCCVTRTKYCPCESDVKGTRFYHSDAPLLTEPTCANIFTMGSLEEQCGHPNLKEKCCKTRKKYCELKPTCPEHNENTLNEILKPSLKKVDAQ